MTRETDRRTGEWTKRRWTEYRRQQGKENPEVPYTSAEMAKKWRTKFPARARKWWREYYARTWGHSGRGTKGGRKVELFAYELLPALGFTNIEYVSAYYPQLPFDFLATLGGERVSIDVTAARWKHIPARHFKLLKALGMRHYLLFIKPDLRYYQLYLTEDDKLYYSAHLKELKKIDTSI